MGNFNINQGFITEDVQELEDGSINNFAGAGFNNDFQFRLNDAFAGIFYKFKTGIFTFDQGAFLHFYHWNPNQTLTEKENKLVVLPNLTVKAEFDRRKSLRFDYELKSSFTNASQFANRFYLQRYNSIFKGSANLENTLKHDFKLRYTKSKGYRGFGIYAVANYSKQIKGIADKVNYDGINQVASLLFVDNSSENWGINARASKKVKKIDFQTGLRYNNTSYLQFSNDDQFKNKNINTSYSFSAKTLYDNLPIIEIGWKQSFGNFKLSDNTTKFMTTKPYINLDYDFLDGFIFSADFTSYTYKNKTLGQKNNYEIANTSLFYQKESSAWSFKIEAQNLFDTRFKNQNIFTSYVIADSKTYILPRILLFSIGYNL